MEIISAEQPFALAYIQRFRRNVPQLERERERLLMALAQAGSQERYSDVVELVSGLAYLAARLNSYEEGEHLVRQGIAACQQIHDQIHLAYLLNRLSGLLCSRGAYEQAHQVWEQSLDVAQQVGKPALLWEPLSSFAHMADVLARYENVSRLAENLLAAREGGDERAIAVVTFIRGFYARMAGRAERAQNDYNLCLDILASQQPDFPPFECFFEMVVRAELARAQQDYTHAQQYTEAAIALGRIYCDPYTVMVLLWDQARFAFQAGFRADAYVLTQSMVDLARQTGALHICAYGMAFLRHFRARVRRNLLSKRELEVLELVALGFSNAEIAEQLVVTLGTVKKHLEHIFDKLDTRSRTQAIVQARTLQLL